MRLEQQGNKLVGALINALPASERQGLKVSDFTLTTDVKGGDFLSDPAFLKHFGSSAAAQLKRAGEFNMFVLDAGRFSKEIFINYQASDIQKAASGDRDYTAFGATLIPHEREHRDGNPSELDAYRRQREVLDRMPGAFTDPKVYLYFRDQINTQIRANGGKP